MPLERAAISDLIRDLVLAAGPSGREAGIDTAIRLRLEATGVPVRDDAAGNLIARIAGRGSATANRIMQLSRQPDRADCRKVR